MDNIGPQKCPSSVSKIEAESKQVKRRLGEFPLNITCELCHKEYSSFDVTLRCECGELLWISKIDLDQLDTYTKLYLEDCKDIVWKDDE